MLRKMGFREQGAGAGPSGPREVSGRGDAVLATESCVPSWPLLWLQREFLFLPDTQDQEPSAFPWGAADMSISAGHGAPRPASQRFPRDGL